MRLLSCRYLPPTHNFTSHFFDDQVNNLHVNGSHEQKEKFLPDCVSGAKIGGMGMSEPGAGTDVLGMKTKATPNANDNTYLLKGQKMWIT